MSDPIESAKEEVRDRTLRVIGFLTAVELGELDHGADLLGGAMDTPQVTALVTALLRLCHNFASDVARLEHIEVTQVYRREAARVIAE
jgi:hypothetical protein